MRARRPSVRRRECRLRQSSKTAAPPPPGCPETCLGFRSGAPPARQSTLPKRRNAATARRPFPRCSPARLRACPATTWTAIASAAATPAVAVAPSRSRHRAGPATVAIVVASAAATTAAARHTTARPTALPRKGMNVTPAARCCTIASRATPHAEASAPPMASHRFRVPPKRPASAAAAPSSAIRPTMRIQRLATSRRDHGGVAARVAPGSGDILTPKAYDPAVGCPSIAETIRQLTV